MYVKNRFLFDTANSLVKAMIDFNDEVIVSKHMNQVIEDVSLHDKYRKAEFGDIFPELDFLNLTK